MKPVQDADAELEIPTLARFATKNKYAGYIGEASRPGALFMFRTWRDLDNRKQAYLTILTWLESSPPEVSLQNPYFFCESGEMTWRDLSATIGEALHEAGKIHEPEPKSIPSEQYVDLFGKFTPDVVGCNARHKAERVRLLGWEPKHIDVKKSFVEEELPVLLKERTFKASNLALA
ncbi:hypothetical protein PRZ48_008816 [Zasmidium cellare]|uniref:Uncharacterized protein n=1 Tax=Zasmidium cellare TaxID=395010 RepID=A0ABR0EGI8_ZASCE|nr:hypothetical protein PRZ48_008816 [Zasmidium cellare]